MLKLSHGRKMEKPDTPDTERKAASSPDANGANGGGSSDPLVIRMPVDVRGVAPRLSPPSPGSSRFNAPVGASSGCARRASQLRVRPYGHVARPPPRSARLGAALAVSLLVGSIGVGVYTLSDEAGAIIAKVPEAAQRIRQRVAAQRSQRGSAILQQVQDAARRSKRLLTRRPNPWRTHEPHGPDATSSSRWRSSSPRSEL